MTKKELALSAKKLRSTIENQKTKLEEAVSAKRLPPSVSEFGFLSFVGAMNDRAATNNPLKVPLSKLNKKQLEKVVKELTFVTQTETFNISGYKNRLKELKQSSVDTASAYGVPSGVAEKWSSVQWANFWRVVDLINETYQLPSDAAIRVVGGMIKSGLSMGDIVKKYVSKTTDKNGTEYELKERFDDEVDVYEY